MRFHLIIIFIVLQIKEALSVNRIGNYESLGPRDFGFSPEELPFKVSHTKFDFTKEISLWNGCYD